MTTSIIIPSRQRADLLSACLRSIVEHQSHPLQIIVVDDASPKESVSQTARAFAGVEVIRLRSASGFCAAVNAGLQAARSPVVQVLNDDTEVRPGWTAAPLARFKADPTVASVAPLVLRWPDGQLIDSAGDTYDPGGFASSRGRGQQLTDHWLQPGEVFSAAASAAFYRREALLAVGGFPASFGAYFDDVDVGFRLRRAGYRCWYEPMSQVLHHGSASHGRRPGRRLAEQLARNEERVFCRHLPEQKRARVWTRHAAVLAAKGVRRWADGTFVPFVMGRVRAWGECVAGR
jgi:GT2 family glycosyltransferase